MSDKRASRGVRVRAFAKINLSLRVLGVRPDGYHDLRTVFQSLDLHDTLTFTTAERLESGAGPFSIECTDPACPVDRTNLIWRAADELWRAVRQRAEPPRVRVRLVKKIPMLAGLGGGSSDAAATLRGLAALWRVNGRVNQATLQQIAATLGADVPFFLEGGTVLGVERGDLLFPLPDWPSSWVLLVLPFFGVSTKDAYEWFDQRSASAAPTRPANAPHCRSIELVNDLQEPVTAHHPQIGRIVRSLSRAGASHAAMSGSGSAVFGVFDSRTCAESAARRFGRPVRTLLTRTLIRSRCQRRSRPA